MSTYDTMCDTVLLARIKAGDQAAVNAALEKHYPELLLHAYSILVDRDDAKDAVQQCLAYIVSHDKLRTITASLKNYLHIALHNQCLSVIRSNEKNKKGAQQWHLSTSSVEYPNLDLEDLTALHLRSLQREINTLDPQQRKSFTLVHCEGYPYTEAAARMGISLNSLKTNLRLAVAAIRKRVRVNF